MPDAAKDHPTALVADDYRDSRLVFRLMLEARGFRVAEAANGEQAVEVARRECPDLILMDLNMPRMDGLMAARLIRELRGACEGVTIVAVTAFDTYGMKDAALEAGCDDYLVKPVGSEGLDKALRRLSPVW